MFSHYSEERSEASEQDQAHGLLHQARRGRAFSCEVTRCQLHSQVVDCGGGRCLQDPAGVGDLAEGGD